MSIVEQERDLYDTVWTIPAYGDHAPGEAFAGLFAQMVEGRGPTPGGWRTVTVLDAGCGSGKGAIALAAQGYDVTCCDLTREGLVPEAKGFPFHEVCLWDDVRRACGRHTWVYCTDVLEHLPPVFAALVVHRLLAACQSGVFLSISLVPDAFGKWVGRPLHQTVLSYQQWRETLGALGEVREARDLGQTGIYLVVPR